MTKKFKTVFLGNPDFSLPALELLLYHPHVDLLWAVSAPDKKKGRGMKSSSPPVADFCRDHRIPCFQTEDINREEDFLNDLRAQKLDLMIVLAFSQFLAPHVLSLPRLGPYNIHTSLLPRHRGAAPIEWALLHGDRETGVSIQKMVSQMDAGDVVSRDKVLVRKDETGSSLRTRLKFQGALTLETFLQDLSEGTLTQTPQDASQVTQAPKLSRQDGLLDWQDSREMILRKVRALNPWPGTHCLLKGKRIKVFQVEKVPGNLKPGEISTETGALLVGAQDGAIRLMEVQLEGKKKMRDTQLLQGRLL